MTISEKLQFLKKSYLRLRNALSIVANATLPVFAANRWTAALYYFIFSRRFDREHMAVLRGRLAYCRNLRDIGPSSPLLRRNIHRLEKGLIMRPRRDVFGEGFILETVHCYEQAVSRGQYDQEELKWGHDVLDEYFQAVINTPTIKAAREVFEHCGRTLPDDVGKSATITKAYKPYPASASPQTEITFEQLERLFQCRRSVRWYTDSSVPSEAIQKVINAASLAPSACNRQPYRIIAVNKPAEAQRIAACAGGTPGWGHQIPAILVLVGDLSAYPYERDRHLIYIDGALAAMQLMLAAETLDLSTCSINWPDVDSSEQKLQSMLHLAPHERVIILLSIGYSDPSGGIPYSQKKTDARITDEYRS